MNYVKNLDGIRGFAIVLVMFFHYDYLIEAGWVGVQLFFVLSGFLITTILMHDRENQPLGHYLKGFYWRRTLRIFPIYYLYLLIVALVYAKFHTPEDFKQTAPFLFTYTYNLFPLVYEFSFDIFFTHFWSLSIEEQFYLFWPIIVYFLSTRQLRVLLVVMILVAPVIRFWLANYLLDEGISKDFTEQIVYRFTFSQWDAFAFGAAIPVFKLQASTFNPYKLLMAGMAMFIGFGIFNYRMLLAEGENVGLTSFGFPLGVLNNYQHVWSYSLLSLVCMGFILICVKYSHNIVVKTVFGNPFMVFLGRISYGLYVYHWVIWMAFGRFLKPYFAFPLLGFVCYSVICIGVAYLSFILIEKPLLSFKNKFFHRNQIAT